MRPAIDETGRTPGEMHLIGGQGGQDGDITSQAVLNERRWFFDGLSGQLALVAGSPHGC